MELTKEYFDSKIESLATKDDLHKAIAASEEQLSRRMDDSLAATEARLIKRIEQSQEQLAQMTSRGFEDLQKRLDVRSNVDKLERQMQEVRRELNLV